jgi:hypothetical protein
MAFMSEEQKKTHDEHRVMKAFGGWLETQGWTVRYEIDHVDVVAERGEEKIFAEVKGKTSNRPGVGVDTVYGQLLRRMPPEEVGEPGARFALVIPAKAAVAALRVPKRVRAALRIDIYTVGEGDNVEAVMD